MADVIVEPIAELLDDSGWPASDSIVDEEC